MLYSGDFETTTNPKDCRVWAWGCTNIYTMEFIHGNTMESFIEWARKQKSCPKIYFHNLKFDGSFLNYWALKNGFRWVDTKDNSVMKTIMDENNEDYGDLREMVKKKMALTNILSTLIDGTGRHYSIDMYFKIAGHKTKKVTFVNSLNIFPNFSVERLAEAFKLPIKKGIINYHVYRPVGHILTEDELAYLKNDSDIVACALKEMFELELCKPTLAGDALEAFKRTMPKGKFDKLFPPLVMDGAKNDDEKYIIDSEIREAYKGAFCHLMEKYAEVDIDTPGMVFDVNGLYPSVMYDCVLPHGIPVAFDGKYEDDANYPLYVQFMKCQFELKKDHIPSIHLKQGIYASAEYLTSSNCDEYFLTLTSIDVQLLYDHYEVFDEDFIGGYKFQGCTGVFNDYIDRWVKEKADNKDVNAGRYLIAKLMQNALYGKFGQNPRVRGKMPYIGADDVLHYKTLATEWRDPLYVPMAAYITALARNVTIRAAQANYDRFIYSDTDSLHLIGIDKPKDLVIDGKKLGAWDHEFTFTNARYLRQKTYIMKGFKPNVPSDVVTKLACAGMPGKVRKNKTLKIRKGYTVNIVKRKMHVLSAYEYAKCGMIKRVHIFMENNDGSYNAVVFDNFRFGNKFRGGLKPMSVPGGVVLMPIDWELKRDTPGKRKKTDEKKRIEKIEARIEHYIKIAKDGEG